MIKIITRYRSHLRSGFFYTGSSLFSTFINILAGFLVLRWVGPEEMGVWQLLVVINTYAIIGNLGLTTGLARELPYLLGQGNKTEAHSLAATTKAYSIFCSLITILILIVGVIVLYISKKESIYLFSFAAIMSIVAINFLKDYVITLFRTNKAFNKLSKVYLAQGTVNILLLPLIYFYHYYGYLIYNVTAVLSSLLLLLLINPIKVRSKFERADFLKLFKTGMPLFLMTYLVGISKTLIKFAILQIGGITMLGLFAPFFAIRNGINTLPKIISQYLYPKFSYSYGVKGDQATLWKPVKNISFLLLFSLSLLVIPLYFFMPSLLESFFPNYLDSLFPCRMALISGIVFSSFIGIFALNSIKAYKERFTISVFYIMISGALLFSIPRLFQDKMAGISWTIVIVDVMYFLVAFLTTRRKLLNG